MNCYYCSRNLQLKIIKGKVEGFIEKMETKRIIICSDKVYFTLKFQQGQHNKIKLSSEVYNFLLNFIMKLPILIQQFISLTKPSYLN